MINGDLKSLLLLWQALARNRRYEAYVSKRDLVEFETRFTNEGLTFITSTLPNIGKALDSFHSTSEWIPPSGFAVKEVPYDRLRYLDVPHIVAESIYVPLFLSKAIECAINGDSTAVDCVRQLTYVFYKLEVDYGQEKVDQFLINFKSVDRDLGFVFDRQTDFQRRLIHEARLLIARVLCNEDPRDIVPSHGSGATACRTPNWDKHHRPLHYYLKLDDVFSYSEYFFLSPSHLLDEMGRLENSIPQSVPRARVCLVPKDSRGPRVISCEPAEMMFIQQGIMRKLYRILETHHLTSGYVNFSDQTVNRELAREASKEGGNGLATIDLSDASDRVSLELIERVFPKNWFQALEACRSEETVLPNGEVVKLNKFAPMGSSCCFPVEALVFWACAVASIRIHTGSRHPAKVYVYGDDIITESEFFGPVMRGLESVGLKVNANKSYWKGPFRESCGGDYHYGVDVTPVRVRKYLSKSRTSLATNADLANSFIAKFGYSDAANIVSVIEQEGDYVYPRSELQLPAVIRHTPSASNDVFFRRRFNKDLQRWEYRTLRLLSLSKRRRPPNWEELFRKQLTKNRSSREQRLTTSPSSSEVLFNEDWSDRINGRYENQLAIADSKLDPGWYTDPHSVVTSWEWTWLG